PALSAPPRPRPRPRRPRPLPGPRPYRPRHRLPQELQPRLTPRGLLVGLLDEAVVVDDHPGDLAGGDQAVVVADRDHEGQAAAFDGLQLGFGAYRAADGH